MATSTHWESRAEPIPGYRLLERLGRGGFGEVWKAEAPGGLTKAIKFVSGAISSEKERNCAEQELKALNRVRGIRHPFILSMERFDIIDGQLMIVMELADRNLDDRLRDCRRQGLVGVPREELLKYLDEAAEALDLMNNEHDLQHLDIKPQNLFLVSGHIKVADFGLVKDLEGHTATVTGGVTPVYAAPETFDGWVSRNSDQYSLAIVYIELLTGQRPFSGPSPRQFMIQHLTYPPDLSMLTSAERPIIERALSKDPTARFSSCAEFVGKLRSVDAVAVDDGPAVSLGPISLTECSADQGSLSTQLSLPKDPHASGLKTKVRSAPMLRPGRLEVDPNGLLRPTLVIGVGGTGLRAIERIRRKLRDRHGEPASWPAIRLMGIDCDPAALKEIEKVEPVAREAHDQTLLCKFRKPNQYFKTWESFKHLHGWLDPNALFQISVAGTTNGYRALGRLALIDNYRRVLARMRAEVEMLLSPTVVESAVTATGEKVRSDSPRVFVIGSMTGGTSSGMFVDLCYLVRRVLLEAGASKPDVEGMLIAEKPGDGRPELGRVNQYALAQDLLDLTQPSVDFTVLFETDGDQERFTAPPVEAVYLFDQTAEHVAEPRDATILETIAEQVIDAAAGRTGKEWDRLAAEKKWPIFRSFGRFSLVYPRRKLARRAAILLGRQMAADWLAPVSSRLAEEMTTFAEQMLVGAGYDPSSIADRLVAEVNSRLAEPIHVLVANVLSDFESQMAHAESGHHAALTQRAISRLKAILGLDPGEEAAPLEETPLLDNILRDAANKAATDLFTPLVDAVRQALDTEGPRMTAGKKTLDGFALFLLHRIDELQEQVCVSRQNLVRRLREIRDRPLFGAKAALFDPAKSLCDSLERYAREKLEHRLREQVVQVYLVLRARLSDAARDLVAVRQQVERLTADLEQMARSTDEAVGPSARTIFPGGELSLDEAAETLLREMGVEGRKSMERQIQATTLQPIGGLWAACRSSDALGKGLAETFVAAGANWVDENLPSSEAPDAFFDRHGDDLDGVKRELSAFVEWAKPSIVGRTPANASASPLHALTILSVPESRAGVEFAECARRVIKGSQVEIVADDSRAGFLRLIGHANVARLLPAWFLEARRLYDQARQGKLSPEIFPQLSRE